MSARKPPRLLGYAAISQATGIKVATLRVWRSRGKLPEADFKGGQSPVWQAATIEPWILAHAPAPVDEAAPPVE